MDEEIADDTIPAGNLTGADLVLRGGAIYTQDAARRWVRALAIKNGRIAALGSEEEIRRWIGPQTRVLELDGRMVLPGFQDAHIHPPKGGLDLMRCNLHDDPGSAAYLETIARYAREHPTEEWILGGGWSMDAFPGGTPTREMLDAVLPDRPAYLTNRDGHGAWVNSRALALAGISRETSDPFDGRIERRPDGEPAGTLQEGAMGLISRLIPPPDTDTYVNALTVAQDYLLSLGITGWQDAWVTPETERCYLTLDSRGDLKARVVGALWWERERGEEQIDELVQRRDTTAGVRYRGTTAKIMLDGVCENFTAAMLKPYLDSEGKATGNCGLEFIERGALLQVVTKLDALGFQVHFHAIGDRAVRNALDAVDAARRANGWNDLRHHIAHIQVIHPADLPRFRQLGVVANAQPFWACEEGYQRELTIPFLGPERSSWQYPFGTLARGGASLAFGSDWPVSTPNPLLILEVAVRRVAPHHKDMPPFFPGERLALPTALAASTIGSAYVSHLDRDTGSIEVDKLADLVILDRDLFAPDAGAIGDACVVMTVIGGEIVYQDNGFSPD